MVSYNHLERLGAIAMTMLLLISARIENIQWVPASRELLRSTYTEYENCIIEKLESFDPMEGLYDQSMCQHVVSSLKSNIPHRCWFGAMQQKLDTGMCIRGDYGCHILPQRSGFWKAWADMGEGPSTFRPIGNADTLMQAAHEAGFRIIKFLGDSMAIQLAHHIGCSFHRRNASEIKYTTGARHFYNMNSHTCAYFVNKEPRRAILCAERAPVSVGTFNHSSKQFRLKRPSYCHDEACHINYALKHISKNYDKVFNIGKKFKHSLFILPLPVVKKLEVEMIEFCKVIYRNAKILKARKIRMLILTPLTQHFNSPRGLYANLTKTAPGTRQPACVSLAGPHPPSEHPDSMLFRKHMNQLFPSWRELIGFFDVTEQTTPFWDMHPEYRVTGFMSDCTHLAYSPFALEHLWHDLSIYIKENYRNGTLTQS